MTTITIDLTTSGPNPCSTNVKNGDKVKLDNQTNVDFDNFDFPNGKPFAGGNFPPAVLQGTSVTKTVAAEKGKTYSFSYDAGEGCGGPIEGEIIVDDNSVTAP
jgi:hypothetical protein